MGPLTHSKVGVQMGRMAFRFATVSGQRVDWRLARNCSFTPAQLAGMYLSLCTLSLAIAVFFWMRGALLVLPFTGVEIVAVGVAFVVYGRHAADAERISLVGTQLVVERETAGRLERSEFDRQWVRVEPKTGDHSLITLSAQGRVVQVGRFVRPELRAALASEIRMALRAT